MNFKKWLCDWSTEKKLSYAEIKIIQKKIDEVCIQKVFINSTDSVMVTVLRWQTILLYVIFCIFTATKKKQLRFFWNIMFDPKENFGF